MKILSLLVILAALGMSSPIAKSCPLNRIVYCGSCALRQNEDPDTLMLLYKLSQDPCFQDGYKFELHRVIGGLHGITETVREFKFVRTPIAGWTDVVAGDFYIDVNDIGVRPGTQPAAGWFSFFQVPGGVPVYYRYWP